MTLQGFGDGARGVGQRRVRARPAPALRHAQAISQ